jgi:hypothetical protein
MVTGSFMFKGWISAVAAKLHDDRMHKAEPSRAKKQSHRFFFIK